MQPATRRGGSIRKNVCIEPVDDNDLFKGLDVGRSSPRFSHAYADLRHLPAILVENHCGDHRN